MCCNSIVKGLILVGIIAGISFSQAPLVYNGRFAIDHDGNARDIDDVGALAWQWGIIASFGMQKNLVHAQICQYLASNIPSQELKLHESGAGWKKFPGFDSVTVYCCYTNLKGAVAHFRTVAEASTASDKLTMLCAGRMEVPWQEINAMDPTKRKYVVLVSHSTWNDNWTDGPLLSHTWNSITSSFGKDGLVQEHIADQNAKLGGGSNWSFLSSMPANTCIPPSAWLWMKSRDFKSGDVSDCGMTWWLFTRDESGTPAKFEQRFKNPICNSNTAALPRVPVVEEAKGAFKVVPSGNTLQIATADHLENGTVTLLNLSGKAVGKALLVQGKANLDLGQRVAGTQILHIQTPGATMTQKIQVK